MNHSSSSENLYLDEIRPRINDLCRGQLQTKYNQSSELNCFYLNTTGRPYLRLNRIPVEELHKRPQILIFHKLLNEYDLETLQNLTKTNQTYILREYERISENFVLLKNQSKVVSSLMNRIEAITGLVVNTTRSSKYGFDYSGEYHKYQDTFFGQIGYQLTFAILKILHW